MRCPVCQQNTPDSWTNFVIRQGALNNSLVLPSVSVHASLDWMYCANDDCGELLVRLHEQGLEFQGDLPVPVDKTYLVRPRATGRPTPSAEVPEAFRRDYEEAAGILDRSPRMSAVLSRRLLADILERYANQTEYGLADRIDAFNKDVRHPTELRRNLHYLREIGDFGAHKQVDDQANVIAVDLTEAEWTLDVIDRLFDYFIIAPASDQKMRRAMDTKLQEAGRKPISPLPDDAESV